MDWMEKLRRDLGFAFRLAVLHPGFTAVAVLSLALGIGANSTVFSAVHAVLMRPLPFQQPERLVRLYERYAPKGTSLDLSPLAFLTLREQAGSLEAMALASSSRVSHMAGDAPARLRAESVSEGFFEMLGRPLPLGRAFDEGEARRQADVVVLSHAFWRREFGGSRDVLGEAIRLDNRSHQIIGVAPRGYSVLGGQSDVFLPLDLRQLWRRGRGERQYRAWARLAPEASLDEARRELEAAAERLADRSPSSRRGWTLQAVPLRRDLLGETSQALLVLLGAVGFILLIACANVANLLMARSSRREREIALRAALGARRSRLIQQLLVENLVLAVIAGAAGVLLALWGVDLLRRLYAGWLPRAGEIEINAWVALFTVLVSIAAGLAFGLGPAVKASRPNMILSLKDARTSTASPSEANVRGLLVVSEVALALVLLIGAGLMIRSATALAEVDHGYRSDKVLTLEVDPPEWKYGHSRQRRQFFAELRSRAERFAGVESSALADVVPPLAGRLWKVVQPQGGALPGNGEVADCYSVSPGYLATLQIPLLAGREFERPEVERGRPVAMVSQALARRLWGSSRALGKRLAFAGERRRHTVVGVVGDIRRHSRHEPVPAVYLPFPFGEAGQAYLLLHTPLDSDSLRQSLASTVQRLDPDLPVEPLAALDDLRLEATNEERFYMLMLSGFAAIAVVMAAVGIFGVLSFVVSERLHEIGIRMAFGARRRDVLKRVLGQGMGLALAGVVLGLAGAFFASGLLTRFLYQVRPVDPATYLLYSLVLSAVALLACSIPALRATRVQPMKTLRYE